MSDVQFPGHERLAYSDDARVAALNELAKRLGVLIHIDGMPYGSRAVKDSALGAEGAAEMGILAAPSDL